MSYDLANVDSLQNHADQAEFDYIAPRTSRIKYQNVSVMHADTIRSEYSKKPN